MEYFRGKHDLRLPDWGPYSKKYAGISHIADQNKGLRFDLSIFSGFYRRKVDVPNVLWESGFHPWEALPDLSHYTLRHELEWKDRVYVDISYSRISDQSRCIRCECVNNTDSPQNIALHYMASIHFPQVHSHGPVLKEVEAVLPASGAYWVDAIDYAELQFAKPRPTDHLVYDGFYRGEARLQGFVRGTGLAKGFGKDQGDRVLYRFEVREPLQQGTLQLQYRMEAGRELRLRVEGLLEQELQMIGTGEVRQLILETGAIPEGMHTLQLTSEGGDQIELDGFVIAEAAVMREVRFQPLGRNPEPKVEIGTNGRSLILEYEGLDHVYGIKWQTEQSKVRQFYVSDLDRFMRFKLHDHVTEILREDEWDQHYTNIFNGPIVLKPNTSCTFFGMVCCGTRTEVETMMVAFKGDAEVCEAYIAAVKAEKAEDAALQSGKPFAFSQQLMVATLATNVVFPVYTKRSYIRHYTPGRWWDSLYTWDSGFIGIGLSELDPELAADCLNAYVTEPGDPHAAFIHNGSLVPVQHYLFLELWNKTQSREWLAWFYPRLRQYYQFYCGRAVGSTTRTLQSNLLKTWDYFYNSGGWDDYPPQQYMHHYKLTETVAPVSNTP